MSKSLPPQIAEIVETDFSTSRADCIRHISDETHKVPTLAYSFVFLYVFYRIPQDMVLAFPFSLMFSFVFQIYTYQYSISKNQHNLFDNFQINQF